MNTETVLPDVAAEVEITTSDGRVGVAVVAQIQARTLTLAGPDVPASPPGTEVTLRWPAGPRGRYAQPATVSAAAGRGKLVVAAEGAATVEQLRRYVRGGGGEKIWLRRYESHNAAEFDGNVRDVSERSFRARFSGVRVAPQEPVWARIELEDQTLEVQGTVLSTHEVPGGTASDLVVVFDAGEAVAQAIRRYVLHRQMLARRAARD